MPADDRTWTDAEQRSGGDALDVWLTGLGLPPSLVQAARPYGAVAAVLDAAAPLIAARAAAEARVPLLSLIEDLTDPDDCRYDHHGYCQAHSLHSRPCPHERAKRVLARTHATTEEDPDAT